MGGLLKLIGQLILAVILIGGSAAVFAAIAGVAFKGAGRAARSSGGSRTRALRSPAPRAIAAGKAAGRSAAAVIAHPRNSTIRTQARADIRKMREEARLKNWLAGEDHARANGTTGTATGTAARPTLAQRLRLVPFVATVPDPGNGGSNGSGQGASGGNGTKPPAQGNGGPPARPSPVPAPAQPTSNGGTTVAGASTASAEKLIEGINEIHSHAAAGGIHAKREAIQSAHEASVRFSAMVQMLARQLAEPGSNYGPEITEPLAKAGQHHQAAAMSLSEADAAISSLINMTVGELATSPRQAPHHAELSENGSH